MNMGTKPSHWFSYVQDTWVKIQIQDVKEFTRHINSVDNSIKFTREDAKENKLAFLDSLSHMDKLGSLNIEVYRKLERNEQKDQKSNKKKLVRP